jgi:hypothetical protein
VAGVPQGSVLAPVLYSLYMNEAPVAYGTHLALFADNTYVYVIKKHETSCSLQTATRTRCSKVVWALDHIDQ